MLFIHWLVPPNKSADLERVAHSILFRGAGLKFYPIPALSPLQGKENLCGAKQGETGHAGWGNIAISIPLFIISGNNR